MKVTTKGQVTIPRHIRQFPGINPHSEIDFEIREDEVVLKKVIPRTTGKSSRLRGSKKGGLITKEWMEATRGD